MKRLTNNLVVAMVAMAAVSMGAKMARAQVKVYYNPGQQQPTFQYNPQPYVAPTFKLQFYGHVEPSRGMVVDSLVYGGLAQRLGLEGGDVIERINGRRIRSQFDYTQALGASGGYGRMLVRDVRSRQLVSIQFTPAGLAGYPSRPQYVSSYQSPGSTSPW